IIKRSIINMNLDLKNLNIIDLISEKHAKLRKIVSKTWIDMGKEGFTDTESYILSLIEKNELTVAQISRIIGISRQGTHKCVKGLNEKDYIMIKNQDSISRDKILSLTTKGKKFCEETLILKEKFENEIIKFIGESNFKILKECLSEDWLIDE